MERQQDYSELSGWTRFRRRFDWDSSGKVLVYSVVVGFLVGLAAVGAYIGYQAIGHAIAGFYATAGIELPRPEDYTATSGALPGEVFAGAERKDVFLDFLIFPRYWILLLLIPAFGGLLCGFLVWTFAPEANGESVDSIIRAFHFRNGSLRNRVAIVKFLSSFLTIGSGGSAGCCGPTMLLGSGIAGALSQSLKLGAKDRRMLLLAGTAGGLGAIFQIPFGGALFAIEVLYASTALELSAVIPCLIASVVGYSTFNYLHGQIPFPTIPEHVGLHHPTDMPVLALMILVIAFCGLFFVHLVLDLRNKFFRRLTIPEFLKPALGGLMLGCVALFCPHVFGGGQDWLNRLVEGQLPFLLIILLILPKMLATAFTVSSNGSGGMLIPSLFIGALIGASLGHLCSMGFEQLGLAKYSPDIELCTLVGMAAFYAGIAKVPFAAAVIVCEWVGADYSLLVPLMVLSLLHIAIQSPTTSLYEEQVLAPIDSEAHFGGFSVDLLRVLTVREACMEGAKGLNDVLLIPAETSIPETARLIAPRPDSLFPVVDSDGRLLGVLPAGEVWTAFRNRKKWATLNAGKLAQNKDITVYPDDDLFKALRRCTLWQITELPVVDPHRPDKLLGILRHREIIALYNERLAHSKWT